MNLELRYCKKCNGAYDFGTNFEVCPECRGIKEEVMGDGGS